MSGFKLIERVRAGKSPMRQSMPSSLWLPDDGSKASSIIQERLTSCCPILPPNDCNEQPNLAAAMEYPLDVLLRDLARI